MFNIHQTLPINTPGSPIDCNGNPHLGLLVSQKSTLKGRFFNISISTPPLTQKSTPTLFSTTPNPHPHIHFSQFSCSPAMGNGLAKVTHCFCGAVPPHGAAVTSEPFDEGLGHSFCYVRPEPIHSFSGNSSLSSKVHHHEETTTFRTISGASVSANTATPLSTSVMLNDLTWPAAAAFESSISIAAVPLQPVPRLLSGPLDRGFLSGPIERGFMSGPLDPTLFSGPLPGGSAAAGLRRSLSYVPRSRRAAANIFRHLTNAISRRKSKESDGCGSSRTDGAEFSTSDQIDSGDGSLHWAQGKAGEDRVHVVISEEHGWVFVGIYDGFNGPDATDYLLSNLYSAVQQELKGLLWQESSQFDNQAPADIEINVSAADPDPDPAPETNRRRRIQGVAKKWEEKQRRWKSEWDRERLEMDRKLKEQLSRPSSGTGGANHSEVLKALSQALSRTEDAYLETADEMTTENPELALMGSCVLVMLMKGEDVYILNVGDSRAVLAQKAELDLWSSDLERISEEFEGSDRTDGLVSLQLSMDHSTNIEEEVFRIRSEHRDDPSAIANDRVKGSLKVTRAFGAGFLKQPKWNEALLEMFRIDYVGTSPYITCNPSLYHHKLGPKDRFLILSSDGLYQYFTNEEAVAEVELFIEATPDGDPAQHLVEEALFRAANKAGLDFHELLEIPQGDRRRYHDDISIIVISLEGRIWRSCL